MAKIRKQEAEIGRLQADLARSSALRQVAASRQGSRCAADHEAPRQPKSAERRATVEDRFEPPATPRSAPVAEATPPAPEPRVDVREKLDGLFREERTDTDWARTAESQVEDKLQQSMPEGSFVRSVECRASMCRVESVHQDDDTSGRFVRALLKDPAARVWSADAFAAPPQPDERGRSVVVAYLAREGETLPSLDAQGSP